MIQIWFCAHTRVYLNKAGVGHDLFGVHYVHQWLHHRHVPNARHIKTVDVLPPCKQTQQKDILLLDVIKLARAQKVHF